MSQGHRPQGKVGVRRGSMPARRQLPIPGPGSGLMRAQRPRTMLPGDHEHLIASSASKASIIAIVLPASAAGAESG
jgi:hypothetical protein